MYLDDRALLMVGETANTADLYYAVGYLFHDPVIYLNKGNDDSLLVCGDFEREGAAAGGKAARVHSFKDHGGDDLPPGLPEYQRSAALTLRVLRDEGIARVVTTNTIPLFTADHLRANGIDLSCQPDLLEKPREVKRPGELAAIEIAQRATERAMDAAVGLIADATVGEDGLLYCGDRGVTAERLRAVINATLLEANCSGDGTITACGSDSAQPHNVGQGPLRAGQPVVIDIFPRHQERRYFADMTRTVSKGVPSAEIARMYEVTCEALELALGLIKPGITGRAVFEAVCRLYEERGYATFVRDNHMPEEGFIHGLGHGVGLEVHEGPRLGQRGDDLLMEGQVVTVEPGLYVPGVGGVRLEDMVYITADGNRNLTTFPKQLAL